MNVVCLTAPLGPALFNILPYNISKQREVGEMNAIASGKAAVFPANPVVDDVKSAIVDGRAME